MYYFNTNLYLTCGHAAQETDPISNYHCSQRRAQTFLDMLDVNRTDNNTLHEVRPADLPSPPATPPPSACNERLTHPLHTFQINALCPPCQEARGVRLEQFDMQMRDDLERRILMRSAEKNHRGADFGQR
jgi:hypothetical protein